MNKDIVDELRHGTGYEGETRWNAADEIESLRASLKEAKASRDEIIEECAARLDDIAAKARAMSRNGDDFETASFVLRSLKSSPSQSPKTEGEI